MSIDKGVYIQLFKRGLINMAMMILISMHDVGCHVECLLQTFLNHGVTVENGHLFFFRSSLQVIQQ